jgi:Ca2+-binding RTX toxin-like protein
LFDYQPGEDTNTFTDLNFPGRPFTIADLTPEERAAAQQIAEQLGITDPTLLANAILDIALTDGDPAFIDGAADQNRLLIASADTTLIGPSGTGARGWLPSAQNLAYQIYFTNPANATTTVASATISEQLDSDLNWNTLELGSINLGGVTVTVPTGRQSYSQQLDLRQQVGYFVNISGKLDPTTGQLSWTLQAIDPNTNAPPATGGFLPPNGQGSVSYRIQSKPGLATETQLTANASVTLNNGTPINTLVYLNTIDAGTPSSSVTALPATIGNPNFTVAWSGSDDGSGIGFYDIYASVDGSPFSLWLDDTTATSAVYNGQVGKTYAFYSVATDNVGYLETAPVAADTQTTVIAATNNPPDAVNDAAVTDEDTAVTINVLANDIDIDGDAINLETFSQGTNGTVTLNNNGTADKTDDKLVYTPNANFSGTDSFTYSVSDDQGGIDTATVTITVNPIEDLILIGDSNNNILEAGKGNDRLEGRAGRDILIGGTGNDILVGGSGGDTLTGGTGSDTFVYQAVTDLGDTITDFKPSEGDKLDLSQLLAGSLYSNDTNPLNAYVRITTVSGSTAVQIDPNGDLAPSVFVTLTTLQGFTGNLGAESFII